MSSDQVTAAALALPPEAKAKLAEQLLDSLNETGQREIDAAWAEEVERRIDAVDRGEERTVPADLALGGRPCPTQMKPVEFLDIAARK